MSFLTILITTHNRSQILRECIDAIYASDYLPANIDIVVVDDGSKDDTPRYLHQLYKDRKLSTVIRNENARGPAAARNKGIKEAKGEYTLIMGDDVILFPFVIKEFCNHIKKYQLHNASVIGNIMPFPERMTAFEYWNCNGGSQFGHYRIPEDKKFDAGDEYFYTSNVITPTRLLSDNPFDESFPYARYEDRELSYRLKKKYNHKIHYLVEAKSYHKHKLPFKKWLLKFEIFTWSALHFSNLYPDDEDLKRKLGIFKALETEFFQMDTLEKSVDLINSYHKHFFASEVEFGRSWIKNIVTMSFRNLQEFFRINYYRTHMKIIPLTDVHRKISDLEAMNQILEKLHDDV